MATVDPRDLGYITITPAGQTITSSGSSVTYNTLTGGTLTTWSQPYNYTLSNTNYQSNVDITSNGINIKDGADITIAGRSLGSILERLEEKLAVLVPNEELESRWEQLREARKQYMALEQELLEKERMWKILKEK